MANNKSIVDISKISFDRERSPLAQKLDALTDEQLFRRYFMETSNEPDLLDDFNRCIDMKDANNNNEPVFPLLNTLVGTNLNYIYESFNRSTTRFIPKGYALNTMQIFNDFEAILNENKKVTRNAALRDTNTLGIHPYVDNLIDFFKSEFEKGLNYSDQLSV